MHTLGQILGLFIIGLLAGLIARIFVRTKTRLGCFGTAIIGVVGSYLGGTLGAVIFAEKLDLRRSSTFLGAIIGSMVALLVLRAIKRVQPTQR